MSFDECERHLRAAAKIVPLEAWPPITQKAARMPTELPVIPLSDEQRRILEQPVDPRVKRILSEIEEKRREMAGAVKSRQIIRFPFAGSGAGHAIRDSDGHWTIVSGSPPEVQHAAII
ncbi:MAG TPA: hypothetical protein VF345_10825 [Chthoniobacterales bacterium]